MLRTKQDLMNIISGFGGGGATPTVIQSLLQTLIDFLDTLLSGAESVLTAVSWPLVDLTAAKFRTAAAGPFWSSGANTPEGAITAPIGSLFSRNNGGASTTLYVKESGVGNTGWIAK